jgi:membrane protease YdiL (CAAX protease family)
MTSSTATLEPRTAGAVGARRAGVVALAATATLLASRLPEIVLREGFAFDGPWLAAIPVAVASGLWIASSVTAALRPLAGFFGVMTGVTALIRGIEVLFASDTWAALAPESAGPMVQLLSERLVLGTLALALAGTVAWFGGSQATYLRLRASTSGHEADRGDEVARRWRLRGPVAIVALVGLTALAMIPFAPASVDLAAAAPFLVMAVLAAVLNSLWEEVAFRALPMGRLAPIVGAGPAVLILAAWFGLGHFYGGMPSGAMGAVVVGAVGIVLGRAMVDTRGLAWPWAIHASIDLTIYVVLALGAAAPV